MDLCNFKRQMTSDPNHLEFANIIKYCGRVATSLKNWQAMVKSLSGPKNWQNLVIFGKICTKSGVLQTQVTK